MNRTLVWKFIISLIFRLINAQLNATFFQPDEFFQAWEPAYADIHGIGFRTWEWHAGIRTSLMPRFFGLIINLSQLLGINHLALGNFVMAVLASLADLYTGLLAQLLAPQANPAASRQLGTISWLLSLGSMFNWYCSTRYFSNSIEMVLVTVALYYWNQRNSWSSLLIAQSLAHLAIALRPSNAFFWLILGISLILRKRDWYARSLLVVVSAVVALTIHGLIMILDRSYYAKLGVTAFPMLEFVRQNFGSRVSEIYGVLPWHWYVSQGVPFLLLGYIPLAVAGWQSSPGTIKVWLALNTAAFSLIAHKEFRFIYFLLPIMHIVVALGWKRLAQGNKRIAVVVTSIGISLNAILAFYFSRWHQRGVVDIINYVGQSPHISKISFLMPCHSTPWHAHFQRFDSEFSPQFLTCEPPWDRSSIGYVDEADQFYIDPAGFLQHHPEKLVEYVAVFEPMKALMESLGYDETQSFYNGLFNEDSRRQGKVWLMHRL